MKVELCKLGRIAAVCNFWKQRNYIKHSDQIISEERVAMQIMARGKFKRTEENEKLCCKWGYLIKCLVYRLVCSSFLLICIFEYCRFVRIGRT
jgi:hypothetical protein